MHPAALSAPVAPRFFEAFEERVFQTPEGPIFYRISGDGPPLLLLHGYPQTSAMWHATAPELAKTYQVICPDLRGYGRSLKPKTDASHTPYAKRTTAGDMVALMDHLGHDRFRIGAHDRGGRVAHRLAADHPGKVTALSVLDIAPTREMYRNATSGFAHAYWHWYWLTLPHPFPETMIAADPVFFWLRKCGAGSAGLAPFVRQALDEYLTAFSEPDAIHGACEDYRAAATIDIIHDDADQTKLQMPLLALWGADGVIEAHFDCLALWRERALHVEGHALKGGHYLAEENPNAVLAAWLPFFAAS
jgi:haloacetate dehalogenase